MIIFVITFMVVAFDRLTKFLVVRNLYGSSIDLIENIFSFTYVENRGAAWGLLGNNNWILMVVIPVFIVIIILYSYLVAKSKCERIAGGLVLGGAIGNYIDRIFYGYVIDFMDFKVWPVFNIADVAIVLGCIIMIIFLCVKGGEKNGKT